jgi:hypothetical protein
MNATLRTRLLVAGLSDDQDRIRALAEELRAEITAGDPERPWR